MKKLKMEKSNQTIIGDTRPSSRQNGNSPASKTKEEHKASPSPKRKTKGGANGGSRWRNSSKQPLKKREGGKPSSLQRQSSSGRNGNNAGSTDDNSIKVPKSKPKSKKPVSKVKKYELEKQTLLIMDQMISQVKDFTNKERYFDYKKISDTIPSNECKKIWESFKSKLRGQFKEGNEEMRQ